MPFTPKANTQLILTILGGSGAICLIGLTCFLILKNYDRIAIRNRSVTPLGFENRLSILIENLEQGEEGEDEVVNN